MIEKMLAKAEVRLGVDYLEHKDELDALAEKVVYTGPIDAYYGYQFGELELSLIHIYIREKTPTLYIVIPCYNEEEVLPITSKQFLAKIQQLVTEEKITDDSRILFVNDGSKDSTWDIIRKLSAEDPHYIGICQSRNRGHQNAVLAGLMEAKDQCDITTVSYTHLPTDPTARSKCKARGCH